VFELEVLEHVVNLQVKMTSERSVSGNAGNNAIGGSTVVGNSRFNIGQISELRLKDDDFNAWVERFELYANIYEINKH